MKTYEILDTPHGKAIKCLVCGMTSYYIEDVRHLFCGKCNKFHDDMEREQETQNELG